MQGLDLAVITAGGPSPWAGKLPGGRPIQLDDVTWHVVVIDVGTTDGKPSVAVRFDLPNGDFVVAECSLALWSSVTIAARARHPEAFYDGPLDPRPGPREPPRSN